jgi:hypothetical protein
MEKQEKWKVKCLKGIECRQERRGGGNKCNQENRRNEKVKINQVKSTLVLNRSEKKIRSGHRRKWVDAAQSV